MEIKVIFQVCSFVMLLVISSIYGFMSMSTEMGLAILAGALGLAFSNIDKISKFKGAGFEAEMCKAVRHAPTGVVHKGTKGGKTGCGVDTKEHSDHWVSTNEKITCDKNGCKN